MKAVGIRELKNSLSEYLRMVRRGEEILVTDRGTVVAEIRPPGQAHADVPYPALLEAARDGRARLDHPTRTTSIPPSSRWCPKAKAGAYWTRSVAAGEHLRRVQCRSRLAAR